MIWEGETVYTLWGYQPKTDLALLWQTLANGDWKATDRGSVEDVYEASMVFKGPRDELEALETDVLDAFRTQYNITCGEGEEIFGADVDYTNPLLVTVVDYGKIEQISFKMWTMPLRLRLLEKVFKSTTPDFTKLRLASWRSQQGSEFDINKQFTYDNYAVYTDHNTEPGIFSAAFTQKLNEMSAIRRYIAVTARGGDIPFPTIGGVSTPFGSRMGAGPFTARIIDWEDLGRVNYLEWGLKLTFARVYDT